MGHNQSRARMVLVSPWLWMMFVVFVIFICIGAGLAAGYGGGDLGSRLLGVGILVASVVFSVVDLSSRIVVADATGFGALLRRRVRWTRVQWAELANVTPAVIPNVVVRVVGKDIDPRTGRLREHRLTGLAGYGAGVRQQRMVAQFNDWIAGADPDWTIDPWLHRSSRPDNR